MIETIILDYLNDVLDVPACMEKPQDIDEFVLIDKTGSGKENHINNAIITIQSYSTTLYKAASLNETLKSAMESIIDLDSISSCSLNSDYNYTDTTTKEYRYQAVFELVF